MAIAPPTGLVEEADGTDRLVVGDDGPPTLVDLTVVELPDAVDPERAVRRAASDRRGRDRTIAAAALVAVALAAAVAVGGARDGAAAGSAPLARRTVTATGELSPPSERVRVLADGRLGAVARSRLSAADVDLSPAPPGGAPAATEVRYHRPEGEAAARWVRSRLGVGKIAYSPPASATADVTVIVGRDVEQG